MIWGAYVHVPWCRIRCPYCAFDIVTGEGAADGEPWVRGVLRDFALWKPEFEGPPTTLYFGGGTPSRLPVSDLDEVRTRLGRPHTTVEANPEDLTDSWLDQAISAGFERISLGVQTLQPHLIRTVGRAHHDARNAMSLLAVSGLDWSADLMFGLPGQSLDDLERDLDGLLAFDPPHISIYGLTIEPGTPYARLHSRRPLRVPDESSWRSMYDRIVARLAESGLHRYEVSNFARAGRESQHNRLYWSGSPYMGLGPSAHGFAPDGRRWHNPSHTAWVAGTPPAVESPEPESRAIDTLLCRLRGVEGLDMATLHPYQLESRVLHQLARAGLLHIDGAHIRLTDDGFPVADAVVRALVAALTG